MTYLQNVYRSDELSREVAQAMLSAVQRNYGYLISEARQEWERRFASSDPSNSCVTVRISGNDSSEFARLFPLETSRQLGPYVTN